MALWVWRFVEGEPPYFFCPSHYIYKICGWGAWACGMKKGKRGEFVRWY